MGRLCNFGAMLTSVLVVRSRAPLFEGSRDTTGKMRRMYQTCNAALHTYCQPDSCSTKNPDIYLLTNVGHADLGQ